MAGPIWWYHTMAYHLYSGVYHIVAFTVAGLILARFVGHEAGAPIAV